jgi:hypothetical protein
MATKTGKKSEDLKRPKVDRDAFDQAIDALLRHKPVPKKAVRASRKKPAKTVIAPTD